MLSDPRSLDFWRSRSSSVEWVEVSVDQDWSGALIGAPDV
jgi:hypothetical protein